MGGQRPGRRFSGAHSTTSGSRAFVSPTAHASAADSNLRPALAAGSKQVQEPALARRRRITAASASSGRQPRAPRAVCTGVSAGHRQHPGLAGPWCSRPNRSIRDPACAHFRAGVPKLGVATMSLDGQSEIEDSLLREAIDGLEPAALPLSPRRSPMSGVCASS